MLSLKASQPPTPPRRYRPRLPEGLEQVILKALATEQDDRYQTMLELAEALRPFEAKRGGTGKRAERGYLESIPTASQDIPAIAAGSPLEELPTTHDIRLAPPGIEAPLEVPTLDLDSLGKANDPSRPGERTDPALPFSPLGRGKLRPPRTLSNQKRWLGIGAGAALIVGLIAGLVLWSDEPAPSPRDASVARATAADLSTKTEPSTAPLKPKTPPPPPPPPAPKTMTKKEVERLLEWTRRAADGGRYTRPTGDNVLELLGRIEGDFPGHPEAQKLRRRICQKLNRKSAQLRGRKRYESALRLIHAWRSLDPGSEDPTVQLVLTQLALGRQALSRRRYRSAMHFAKAAQKEMPDSPSATEFIGDIYARRKKFKSAITHYEAALQSPKASAKQKRRLKKKLKRASKRR